MTDSIKMKHAKPVGGRRGRPPRSQEDAITEKIVKTALRRFLKDGYGATSTIRIIDDAGVSSGTLYARFPNKAALFAAAVNYQVMTWERSGPSRLAKSGRESLYNVIYNAALGQMEIRDRQDVRDFSNLLMQEAERFPELARIYSEDALKISLELLTEAILQCPEGRRMTRRQAAEFALTTTEAVNGWAQMQIFSKAGSNPDTGRKNAAKRIAGIIAKAGNPD